MNAASSGGQQQETPCKFMGILAVTEAVALDARKIGALMGRRFPSYKGPPAEAVEPAADAAPDQEGCRIRIGDMVANISVLNQPIYPTILDAAVRAAAGWPGAGQQLSGHRAQIIVELISPSGGTVAGRVDAASIATMLCAAVVDRVPVLGIYWKNGGTVTEPRRFQNIAGGLMSGEMPLDIWLQVVQPKESPYVMSTGLSDFLSLEMEFKATGLAKDDAVARGFLICRQLLAHGDILRDNERIPLGDAEDIWPRPISDGQREDIPVWSLTIEKRRSTAGLPGPGAARAPLSGPPPDRATPPPSISPPSPGGVGPSPSSGGAIQMPRGRPGGDKCESGSFMTILALEKPASVVEAELMERMRQQFPQLQSRTASPAQPGVIPEPGAPMIFFMGDCMVTVMFIDGPVPPGTLTIAAQASRVWPEADKELAAHRGHVIVHAKSKTGDWNGALNSARNVTVVSAALAGMLPTIGVYWSAGWVVSKPGEFIDGAEKMLAGNYPAHLWVQFWFLGGPKTQTGEPTNAILTTGLEPFFGREIEFLPAAIPPTTILHRLLGAMQYLLTSGPVLEHGNTLGVSLDEHIRVLHADQGQRPGIPIYKFALEALDETVSPFPPEEPAKPAASAPGATPPPRQTPAQTPASESPPRPAPEGGDKPRKPLFGRRRQE